MSSNKKNITKQKFQLKPKHLIRAILGICIASIIALVVGVVGTFKSHDKESVQEGQQTQQENANRVEVWKPAGVANTQGSIVLNPDALNPKKQVQKSSENEEDSSAESIAMRNPFSTAAPSKNNHSTVLEENDERGQKKYRPRPAEERVTRADGDVEAAKPEVVRPAAPITNLTQAERPRAEPIRSKPEAERRVEVEKPKPKLAPVETKPAPTETKRQPKEVMDNLF